MTKQPTDINQVVNVKAYPYVWFGQGSYIATRYGRINMPYGFLSDGASRVADRCPEAFFAHDKLYLLPTVYREGRKVRLNHFQCDIVYGDLLRKRHQYLWSIDRPLALMIWGMCPWSSWVRYRRREKVMGSQAWQAHIAATRVVPQANRWTFPNFETANAFIA